MGNGHARPAFTFVLVFIVDSWLDRARRGASATTDTRLELRLEFHSLSFQIGRPHRPALTFALVFIVRSYLQAGPGHEPPPALMPPLTFIVVSFVIADYSLEWA